MPLWLNQLWFKIKYPFKLALYGALDLWVKQRPVKTRDKTLLIFRLDLLGDYLLSQKFFSYIPERGRFEGYKMTLCCNEIVAELAQELHGDLFEAYIFINRNKFINSAQYRLQVLQTIRDQGFEVVVCPMHTRQYLLESVVRCSGAPIRIGAMPVGHHMLSWQKRHARQFYTEIIETQPDPTFEFYRNRQFFCKLTVQDLPVNNNSIQVRAKWLGMAPDVDFVVLAPGASVEQRQWPIENFARLVGQIYFEMGFPVYVMGGPGEKSLYTRIKALVNPDVVLIDMTGKLALPQVLGFLSRASLLVSNESAPVHMAAMVGTPTICLSNGNHFRRWNPYPQLLSPKVFTLYPDAFFELDRKGQLLAHTRGSTIPMSELKPEQVWEEVKRVMHLS